MAAMPTAAMADSNIAIISAGPDGSGNPYDLTVQADDPNPGATINTMTAHVFVGQTEVTAPNGVTMTAVDTSNPLDQIWTANPPINPSLLTPGTNYTVTVDVSDSTGENDIGLQAPGQFSFVFASTKITASANPPAVTANPQTVVFSGTVTGLAPGSSTPVGIAGVPIILTGTKVATTMADGSWSYPLQDVNATSTFNFSVTADTGGNYPAASAQPVEVLAQPASTTITASAQPSYVSQGATDVTFSGTVLATPPNSSNPVPLVDVPVSISNSLSNPVMTDSNGNFTFSNIPVAPGSYTFSVGASPTNLYTAATSPSVQVLAEPASTAINVSPNVNQITFGSQNVSISGPVTVVPYGQSSAVSIGAGIPVNLSINGGSNISLKTDATGYVSYQANALAAASDFQFSIAASPQTNPLYSGAVADVAVPLNPGHTEMTVTATPNDVNLESQTVTFTGQVTVTPAGNTNPVDIGPNIPIDLSVGDGPASQVTKTDDASGDFSVTINNITEANEYNFSVAQGTFYSSASEQVPIGLDQLQSNLLVMPNQSTVTEGSQDVTFNGSFTGTPPGGGPNDAIVGVPVMLSINGGPPTQVKMTDASGNFTYTAHNITQASDYNFSVASTSTYTTATDDVPIGISPAQTRITGIAVTPARVRYGQIATLTGTVQYLGGGIWTALSNAAVHVSEGTKSVATATTGAGGAFSASMPTTNGSAWSAVVSAGILTQQAPAAGNLDIFVPLKVLSFAAKLKVNGDLAATGCLQVTAPVRYAPETPVQIQYRPARRGPWRLLGRMQLHNSANRYKSCPGANESYFNDSIRARLANAYYRAYFPANASYTSAASKPVHAWRYQTRIVRFTVRPRAISGHEQATVSGRLQVHRSTWRPYANQPVRLIYNDKGTNYWNSYGQPVRTNSRGRFSLSVSGGAGSFVAVLYAQYRGDKTHLASESPGIDLSINGGQSNTASVRIAPDRFPTVVPLPMPYLAALTPGPPLLTGLLLKAKVG